MWKPGIVILPQLNTKLGVGKLATLDNQIDQTTGTIKLRANFDNKNNKLFPNQFVKVRLLVQQNVTLVTTATLLRNSQTTYVFLVQPNNKVTVRPITIGTTEGGNSEVISGLSPGDVVVMTGVDKLQEGTQVKAYFRVKAAGAAPVDRKSRPVPLPVPRPPDKRPSAYPVEKAEKKVTRRQEGR